MQLIMFVKPCVGDVSLLLLKECGFVSSWEVENVFEVSVQLKDSSSCLSGGSAT
jgi:hypothetical protein